MLKAVEVLCAKDIDGKVLEGSCSSEDGRAAERIVSVPAKKYGLNSDFAASASTPVVTQSKFVGELLRRFPKIVKTRFDRQ
jgi:hypothetical protein